MENHNLEETEITADLVYQSVDPSDFNAMLEVDRYNDRTTAFDKIISATHNHFWDPMDTKYIDFSVPFDVDNEYMINPDQDVDLSVIGDLLNEKDKIRLVNMNVHWSLSSILHGEQGALNLSSSLCHILKDPGAQEYAANQTREEARHVAGFSRYIHARWGQPMVVGPALGNLLNELVNSKIVWKKLVGMQMLVEGLAMGAFATFYRQGNDPLLTKLMQLVMTDEAFHHKFGKIWADRTIPNISPEERDKIEDWSWEVFHVLLYNLSSPEQKKPTYEALGLDWKMVQERFIDALTNDEIRRRMSDNDNIFRVLVKTLFNAGIITDRTAYKYAPFVDLYELEAEGTSMVGDEIAEEGIKYLMAINGDNGPVFNFNQTAAE